MCIRDSIYAAVGIGCFLLVIAMLINIYSCFRRRDYGEGIFGTNGIVGLLLCGSLVVGLVGQLVLNLSILTPLYIVFLIGIPLICLFLSEPLVKLVNGRKDWKPEKWGEYCMQSFFELFEGLLSYVTNTMSFLRVGAFVLVHAGMMSVVFTLAEMTTGVGNIAIVVIGNAIVMAMEALLVAKMCIRDRDLFAMIMMVEITDKAVPFHTFSAEMEKLSQETGLSIHVMHEDIFNSMHRI